MADSSPKKAGRHIVTIVETRTWNIEVERDDDSISVGDRESARGTALIMFTEAKEKDKLPHDGHPEITAQWTCTTGYGQLGGDAPVPVPVPKPKPSGDDHHEGDSKPKPKQDD